MATFKVIGRGQDGKYMDDYAREDVIAYVLQNDKTPHHCIGGAAVNVYNALQEMTLLARPFHKDTGLRLRHSVISFENDRVSNSMMSIRSLSRLLPISGVRIRLSTRSMRMQNIYISIW